MGALKIRVTAASGLSLAIVRTFLFVFVQFEEKKATKCLGGLHNA
jgi:hypothetical protein